MSTTPSLVPADCRREGFLVQLLKHGRPDPRAGHPPALHGLDQEQLLVSEGARGELVQWLTICLWTRSARVARGQLDLILQHKRQDNTIISAATLNGSMDTTA